MNAPRHEPELSSQLRAWLHPASDNKPCVFVEGFLQPGAIVTHLSQETCSLEQLQRILLAPSGSPRCIQKLVQELAEPDTP